MSDQILPLLSGIKLEMQMMNTKLSKMVKTHVQLLSETWITKEQVMAVLKISARTLETLKASGKLPFSKINGLLYYRCIDIESLLLKYYVKSTDNHSSIFKSKSND